MKYIQNRLLLLVLLFSFFSYLWMVKIHQDSQLAIIYNFTPKNKMFRNQNYSKEFISYVEKNHEDKKWTIGEIASLYQLETRLGKTKLKSSRVIQLNQQKQKFWKRGRQYDRIKYYSNQIWKDVVYFPVPKSTKDSTLTTNYVDSWMYARTYGGKRGHEGSDIMASKNQPGLYPILSVSDGIVENLGWLEKGGYRILIHAPSGESFYYAHLDSYAPLKEQMKIKAGQLLGFMGNTGYGQIGTKGKFAVHLHFGIYLYENGAEISVNPYWILRYLEKHQLKYAYS